MNNSSARTLCQTNADSRKINRHTVIQTENKTAFTLIELLVVISIISLLMAILMPVLNAVRSQSKRIICGSSIRQFTMANISYAHENNGFYVPAALDIYGANKHRWFGLRNEVNEPFDCTQGLLTDYLGQAEVKCSLYINFDSLSPSDGKYDQGSGGYGYNMVYIGSKVWIAGYEDQSCRTTAKDSQISRPVQTVMFADTAMLRGNQLIEYSFVEPRYFVIKGEPVIDSGWNPSPSIHFRHHGKANIAWADGHVSSKKRGDYNGINDDGSRPETMDIGWFEPMDNTLFDLK